MITYSSEYLASFDEILELSPGCLVGGFYFVHGIRHLI
nr:MAG TPA: hypothetical protein [Caudoviricetes sp.]